MIESSRLSSCESKSTSDFRKFKMSLHPEMGVLWTFKNGSFPWGAKFGFEHSVIIKDRSIILQ